MTNSAIKRTYTTHIRWTSFFSKNFAARVVLPFEIDMGFGHTMKIFRNTHPECTVHIKRTRTW